MISRSIEMRLQCQHEGLVEVFKTVAAGRLEEQIIKGKWTIKENLAHLVCYQTVFIERIKTILYTDEPILNQYKAEEDERFNVIRNIVCSELWPVMLRDRKQIINLLSPLSDAELARCGTHPVYGKLSICQWAEFFLLHEAHHMMTIFRLAHSPQEKLLV